MPNELTPAELARETGLDRRDVIARCMAMAVPMRGPQFMIDKTLFLTSLDNEQRRALLAYREAAHFVLFDSSGNMIDSFDSADEAAHAAADIQAAHQGNLRHFNIVAYDANGDVIDPRSPSAVTAAT